MLIRTATSAASDPERAIAELDAQLGACRADFVSVHCASDADVARLADWVAGRFPDAAVHGGTSCLGAMTEAGASLSGSGIAIAALADPDGQYGTASGDLGDDPRGAAVQITRAALADAGRPGECPALVWLSVAPGAEERVLDGIKDVVGAGTLIVGGSTADNTIAGAWQQFSRHGRHAQGCTISVLFPSVPVAGTYHSGYVATGPSAVVTALGEGATGRHVLTLDGLPAAQVYARWSGIAMPDAAGSPVSVLADATWHPLGRVAGHFGTVPFHLLAHPAVAHPDGALDLFADVSIGDRLWLMEGTPESLVRRAGSVAAEAIDLLDAPVAGALVVYCAGCMLGVRDRMGEVVGELRRALGEVPFLGLFTFGEQGAFPEGASRHGNLMISCTVLAKAGQR